jgi:hypothetical protein
MGRIEEKLPQVGFSAPVPGFAVIVVTAQGDD